VVIAPSDTSSLPPPDGLREWLHRADPQKAIFEQSIPIDRTWWSRELTILDLQTDALASDKLSRGDVFALADGAASSPKTAEALLWNTLAWGTGNKRRLIRKRLQAYVEDRARLSELLCKAAATSRTDPEVAYRLLRPKQNAIKYLGPAFFTKFLYFAGGGSSDHPCCILDDRVAASLQSAGWRSLPRRSDWWPSTYGRYMELLRRWRDQTGAPRLDLIERFLFDQNGKFD
jgi:hypothetical protein